MRALAATVASIVAIGLLSPAARLQEQTQKGGEEECCDKERGRINNRQLRDRHEQKQERHRSRERWNIAPNIF